MDIEQRSISLPGFHGSDRKDRVCKLVNFTYLQNVFNPLRYIGLLIRLYTKQHSHPLIPWMNSLQQQHLGLEP